MALRPLGDAFTKLIKMIAPIIFTTLAMVIGLVVVNTVRPGDGIGADPVMLDQAGVAQYGGRAEEQGVTDFLLGIIPGSYTVPVAGIALILGIDRFMSEARAITNIIGNGVATVAIARWEGALDVARMNAVLAGEKVEDPLLGPE